MSEPPGERRAAACRQQMERQAALGQLLAVIAHEVRNDLATIRASLQVARKEARAEANPSLDPLLEQVIQDVDQTSEFMEILLQTASPRLETPRPVELTRLVRETLRIYRSLCDAREVEVDAVYPSRQPWVVVDPSMLRHAVGNLVRNALDAMPQGGRLQVSIRERPPDWAEVVVKDSGPGLSAQAQQRVFQSFVTSQPEGTGLGLALVRQVAVAHGGSVTLESRPGEGAAFTLALPLAPDPQNPPTE